MNFFDLSLTFEKPSRLTSIDEVLVVYRPSSGRPTGSSHPRSHVIDPGCWDGMHAPKVDNFPVPKPPRPQISAPQGSPAKQYQLEELPRFPRTLFKFKEYDGAKAFTALLLILSFVYFLAGFLGFLFDHTPWLKELLPLTAPPALVAKTAWWQFWKPLGATVSSITSYVDFAFRLFIFLCSYCLTWATFDPRNIEGYVMGFFNACIEPI